nr:rab11 family-interacting protein 3-like [Odocoileus virginianus texanus]
MEPEGDGPAHSASVRAQDFSRSHHLRGEVDFFPSFVAPEMGHPALELGPGDPDGPSDFSQTHPLTSEPAGCPEDSPRLRAVFDALDGDGDGFVRIEDFVQFATVYGAEQEFIVRCAQALVVKLQELIFKASTISEDASWT